MNTPDIPHAHGLGDTQRRLLEALKRGGRLTLSELAQRVDLAPGTLREHVNALGSRGLVKRAGNRRAGPGRPEVVYALAPAAEALFPSREGQLLAELIRHLAATGQTVALERFFSERVAARRDAALERVRGKAGRERLEEVARVLSEEGFMAEVTESGADGRASLRLCHCPLKEAVAVTPLPCVAELALVEELLGERPARTAYLPSGDLSCSYEVPA